MNHRTTFTIAGVVLVAAAAAVCGGGGGYSPAAPTATAPPAGAAADVVITIVGMNGALSFSPNPANVKVGQTVAWRNADSVGHTATADNRAFDTGTLARDATSTRITETTAGAVPYHCGIHPSMTGTLNVTP